MSLNELQKGPTPADVPYLDVILHNIDCNDITADSITVQNFIVDGNLDVHGNTTMRGTLGVTGAVNMASDLTVHGNLGVTGSATVNNIQVATSGGIPYPLNYMEMIGVNCLLTNLYNVDLPIRIQVCQIGNFIMLAWPTVVSSVNFNNVGIITGLPIKYAPPASQYSINALFNNAAPITGGILVSAVPTLTLFPNQTFDLGTGFTMGANGGILAGSLVYELAVL